jgi:hypothetical protein
MWLGIVLMPIRIRISISIKTIPIHNTDKGQVTNLKKTEIHILYVYRTKPKPNMQCGGSGMFIPNPDFYPSRIPDLGSRIQGLKKAPDPGSGSATLLTRDGK